MNKLYHMLLGFAAMGIMFDDSNRVVKGTNELSQAELNELRSIRQNKVRELQRKRGLKEWDIDGVIVMARDERNAIRKANNALKLINNTPQP